jgi:hypothetical protein
MLIGWCMGVTLGETMHQEWQNGCSRSETKIINAMHEGAGEARREMSCSRGGFDVQMNLAIKPSSVS